MFPSLSAVGSWEEVLLFSMDFTVSQNFFEFVLQDAKMSGSLVVFLSQDSDMARTSGLAECDKAVNKTNLGRRLLMLILNQGFYGYRSQKMRAPGE